MMSTYTVETIVRGYHVYRAVWEAAIGQVLPCKQERGNVHDPYTCLLYTSPSPRDATLSRMPSSA